MLDLIKLDKDLERLRQLFCSNYSCGHFDCPCCMNECYGETCAIEILQNGLKELEEKKEKELKKKVEIKIRKKRIINGKTY